MKLEDEDINFNKYIFKVCRVHNVVDLNNVIKNGATMIGIHAVILNRNLYLENEKKYKPLITNLNYDIDLPLHTLEIESIKEMQKYIPSNIKQAILFQRPIGIEKMKKCCDIYNLPLNKIYIQLHHRTNKEYIDKIKHELSIHVIPVVGIFQEDFYKYFWDIHNTLNPDTDYILIDLSVHQSDLSIYNEKANKLEKIKEISKYIKNNTIPILLAEDTDVKNMKKYLKEIKKHNILIKGLDMQNSVEFEKKNQNYKFIIKDDGEKYQVRIRKSNKLLLKWKDFVSHNWKKYFK